MYCNLPRWCVGCKFCLFIWDLFCVNHCMYMLNRVDIRPWWIFPKTIGWNAEWIRQFLIKTLDTVLLSAIYSWHSWHMFVAIFDLELPSINSWMSWDGFFVAKMGFQSVFWVKMWVEGKQFQSSKGGFWKWLVTRWAEMSNDLSDFRN